MSQQERRLAELDLPPPVCETCGFVIDERGQDCPARDEGVCYP